MIQVLKPVVDTETILNELRHVLESGWIGLGPKTKEFEELIAQFLNVKYVCALNSCTAALHLAIKALNLKEGSKVLTTPITFVSTNHVLLYERLEPIFCDVEKLTGNLDVSFVEDAIKKYKVKAIMVVHLGGYSVEMKYLNEIASKYSIPIIEDCAHAFGAYYEGKRVGDTNNLCVWSFHAVKNLPIGDGGAITTNNEAHYKLFNKLRWLGINKDTVSRSSEKGYTWEYDVEFLGYKYHLNDILSVLGLVGIKDVDKNNQRRKYIAEFYLNNITNTGCIKPDYKNNRTSSYHFVPLFFKNRDNIYNKLIQNNIYPGMHYKRNDEYKLYNNFIKINGCKNSEWYQNHEITLPIHLELSDKDLEFIVDVINKE